VKRLEKFLISQRPYAVNLSSLHTRDRYFYYVDAVWFRRRSGVTVACIGTLHDIQGTTPSHPERRGPTSAVEFLERAKDGRHGGACSGRWDGEGYWGNETLETQNEHLTILQPMLANYPEIPAGFDGWWRY
jgi:hypothetical protein